MLEGEVEGTALAISVCGDSDGVHGAGAVVEAVHGEGAGGPLLLLPGAELDKVAVVTLGEAPNDIS